MARLRQKLERFPQFLQRNSELLSVPQRVHRRLWTRHGTDKSSLLLCKNHWNRSSFCRIRAIFSLSCKRPYGWQSVRACYFPTCPRLGVMLFMITTAFCQILLFLFLMKKNVFIASDRVVRNRLFDSKLRSYRAIP